MDVSSLRLNWYRALASENCIQIRNLLEQSERLVLDIWKANASPLSSSSRPDQWVGRTALHVAVRRGDVELTKWILSLVSELSSESNTPNTALDSLSDQGPLGPFLGAKDGDYELDAIAMAVINGNHEIVRLLRKASLNCPSNPYEIRGITWLARDNGGGDRATSPARSPNSESGSSSDHNSASSAASLDKEAAVDMIASITEKAWSESTPQVAEMKNLYHDDCDFNFLDMRVYFLHFTFSTWTQTEQRMRLMKPIQQRIVSEARKKTVLEYLLGEVFDGQGRTVLHVAVDSGKVEEFLDVVAPVDKDVNLNVADSAGRTPLYRAAATNHLRAVEALVEQPTTNMIAEVRLSATQWGEGLDIDKLSERNGFKSECVFIPEEKLQRKGFNKRSSSRGGPGPQIDHLEVISSTALHIAIIHGNDNRIVEKFLNRLLQGSGKSSQHPGQHPPRFASEVDCFRRFTSPVGESLRGHGSSTSYNIQHYTSTMHLAVLMDNLDIIHFLLKEQAHKRNLGFGANGKDLPSLLLAAAMGNPDAVKQFLEQRTSTGRLEFDPNTIRDSFGNTALHHAVLGMSVGALHPHLLDFVGCDHVLGSRHQGFDEIHEMLSRPYENIRSVDHERADSAAEMERMYGARKQCINLLLQADIDIRATNKSGQTASESMLGSGQEFARWWNEKEAKELRREDEQLNEAANAISVTAALVATASYVGPLQPPLGYATDASGARVEIMSVRVFVVCDTLSFYLALAAIILALLTLLPAPYEGFIFSTSLAERLVRSRILVAFAVTLLFPSIICVLMAFAAGSIAVVPDHGLAHQGLTVSTIVVGGSLCLLVIAVFARRLLKLFQNLGRDIVDLVVTWNNWNTKWIPNNECFPDSEGIPRCQGRFRMPGFDLCCVGRRKRRYW